MGAHLKNTVAIGKGRNIFVSQHIGDLATTEANNAFERVIRDFRDMYQINHPIVVSDLHPDYLSTKYGENHFPEVERVQHHLAHFAACMAENQLDDEVIGVSWDGTGYGEDGTIWGGEFFRYQNGKYEHVAQLRKFPLPGGDLAIKEPRRSALGILYEIYAESIFRENNLLPEKFSGEELNLFQQMLTKNINCPKTSSAGRLFDAVASLLDIRQKINYEGQAAMMLEFSVATSENGHYPFTLSGTDPLVIDWQKRNRHEVSSDFGRYDSKCLPETFFEKSCIDRWLFSKCNLTRKNRYPASGERFYSLLASENSTKRWGHFAGTDCIFKVSKAI
ncbi:MAG: hypothetical protein P8048_08190 [Calditrichia bacterium]